MGGIFGGGGGGGRTNDEGINRGERNNPDPKADPNFGRAPARDDSAARQLEREAAEKKRRDEEAAAEAERARVEAAEKARQAELERQRQIQLAKEAAIRAEAEKRRLENERLKKAGDDANKQRQSQKARGINSKTAAQSGSRSTLLTDTELSGGFDSGIGGGAGRTLLGG